MAAGIVDGLEPVQVEVQQRIGFATVLGARHGGLEQAFERFTIDQTGQPVMAGLVAQLRSHPTRGGHCETRPRRRPWCGGWT